MLNTLKFIVAGAQFFFLNGESVCRNYYYCYYFVLINFPFNHSQLKQITLRKN